jgi:CPA1 family monovalent cation:H+ antiporter
MTAASAIEFLIWLLIAASVIAVIALRARIPYMVALVLGGLALGTLHFPILASIYQAPRPDWLTPDVILILFLPVLLFEGSLKINLQQLTSNLKPILLLATVGVLGTTLVVGYSVHWLVGIPLMVALLFGAIISATDPIAVMAVVREMSVAKRLALLLEGESLFNDGTAVVLFQILLAGVVTGSFSLAKGLGQFLESVLGGVAVGTLLGYLTARVARRIDEPQVEITLTTILAYSAYLLGHHLHVSGVIATVVAGLVMGNAGKAGMSVRTRLALWSFWEYASFVINSILFLLIGLEVDIADLVHDWRGVAFAIGAVLVGRALIVYGLTVLTNLFSQRIEMRWQHVLVWGGLHGALSLALALSLHPSLSHGNRILTMTFGVVAFSMIVQGLTIRPLIRSLGISIAGEDEVARIRAQQIATSSARAELDEMLKSHLLSHPVYERLRQDLDRRLLGLGTKMEELYSRDSGRAAAETQTAQLRLMAAERSAIEESVRDGLISPQMGASLIDEIAKREAPAPRTD